MRLLLAIRASLASLATLATFVTAQASPATYLTQQPQLKWGDCNDTCVHHLLFKASYASASNGVIDVVKAFNSSHWCFTQNLHWCPQLINTPVSGIADQAINETILTIPNVEGSIPDANMLSAISAITTDSQATAMIWAKTHVNGTGNGTSVSYDPKAVKTLDWTIWQLTNNQSHEVDALALSRAMNAESLELTDWAEASLNDTNNSSFAGVPDFNGTSNSSFSTMSTYTELWSSSFSTLTSFTDIWSSSWTTIASPSTITPTSTDSAIAIAPTNAAANHEVRQAFEASLPFLAAPMMFAPFLFKNGPPCTDPILCNPKVAPKLARMLDGTNEAMPKKGFFRWLKTNVWDKLFKRRFFKGKPKFPKQPLTQHPIDSPVTKPGLPPMTEPEIPYYGLDDYYFPEQRTRPYEYPFEHGFNDPPFRVTDPPFEAPPEQFFGQPMTAENMEKLAQELGDPRRWTLSRDGVRNWVEGQAQDFPEWVAQAANGGVPQAEVPPGPVAPPYRFPNPELMDAMKAGSQWIRQNFDGLGSQVPTNWQYAPEAAALEPAAAYMATQGMVPLQMLDEAGVPIPNRVEWDFASKLRPLEGDYRDVPISPDAGESVPQNLKALYSNGNIIKDALGAPMIRNLDDPSGWSWRRLRPRKTASKNIAYAMEELGKGATRLAEGQLFVDTGRGVIVEHNMDANIEGLNKWPDGSEWISRSGFSDTDEMNAEIDHNPVSDPGDSEQHYPSTGTDGPTATGDPTLNPTTVAPTTLETPGSSGVDGLSTWRTDVVTYTFDGFTQTVTPLPPGNWVDYVPTTTELPPTLPPELPSSTKETVTATVTLVQSPPTSPEAPPPRASCHFQWEIAHTDFNVWGINWDQAKLDGNGGRMSGNGLLQQLGGCGHVGKWRFEHRANEASDWDFHASGRCEYRDRSCVERAFKLAGAPHVCGLCTSGWLRHTFHGGDC